MGSVDRRGRLKEEPFTFHATKDRKVFIHCYGKQIMILKGSAAEKFLSSVAAANGQQAQLLMARMTGHFKHGNER